MSIKCATAHTLGAMHKILSTVQVAAMLSRPLRTIQYQAATGALPGHKLPGATGSYVFSADDIAPIIDAQADEATTP